MGIRKLKSVTPGSRFATRSDFVELTTHTPEKKLTRPLRKSGGRNNTGRITIRRRGGGHKRRYRIIDFKRNKFDIPAKVQTIEYDPNRTARIALLAYADGEKRYIIAPNGLKVGDSVISGERVAPDMGNALQLRHMPPGTFVHAVELRPGAGATICRSAGTVAQILGKQDKYVSLKLPSGEVRMVLGTCMASVGTTSNPDHMNTTIGKAGRNRWLGRRPQTRGVAMNPVDHPMGGGEGKSSGGHPRSPWGQMAKGKKTRNPKKVSSKYIIRRRKTKN